MATKTIEYTETTTLVTLGCASCGVLFAMPLALKERFRREATTFYCPSGHRNWYGESDADKAEKRAEEAEREATRLRAENDQAWARVTEERKARTAAERETKRVQKRATAGICQECHRQFQDVVSHMANRHGTATERSIAGKAEKAKRASR